jgi:hypothetical protein
MTSPLRSHVHPTLDQIFGSAVAQLPAELVVLEEFDQWGPQLTETGRISADLSEQAITID